MTELWAIDPGGYDATNKTSGLAIWEGDRLVLAISVHAPTLLGRLWASEKRPHVVYEGWRTRPGGFGGSQEPTAMTIGALRWICDFRNLHVVAQMPSDKPRGLALMSRHGIEHTGKNQHARDAETHGWLYVLNRKGTT